MLRDWKRIARQTTRGRKDFQGDVTIELCIVSAVDLYERSQVGFFDHVCLDNNRDASGGHPDLRPPVDANN